MQADVHRFVESLIMQLYGISCIMYDNVLVIHVIIFFELKQNIQRSYWKCWSVNCPHNKKFEMSEHLHLELKYVHSGQTIL